MPTKYFIPRWSIIVGGVLLMVWAIGTIFLAMKYLNLRSYNRKYKSMYSDLRGKCQSALQSERLARLELSLTVSRFPEPFLKRLESANQDEGNVLDITQESIVVLFSDLDCGACMQRELHLWQDFFEREKETAGVFGVANTKEPNDLWRSIRGFVTFPTYWDVNGESVFDKLGLFHTPAVLLIDSERRILAAHLGMPGKDRDSFEFKERVVRILQQRKERGQLLGYHRNTKQLGNKSF